MTETLRRGLLELDFLLAAILLVSMAALYLQFTDSQIRATAESKQVASLETNSLKASELLKRKCNWNAQQCSGILSKLNATVLLEGESRQSNGANYSNIVCVRRLFAANGGFKYAEVCST